MSGLTRDQLAAISQVHAVAMNLLSGNPVPMMAVAVLQDLPDLGPELRAGYALLGRVGAFAALPADL